ncbi:protein prenyltransferase alpha subunit repeat domain-containing protein [Phthorimaea operculella]|nr:protein prenyltransferase alpha subunit repeat domain-containing protein [Phthorimaea operculella]
MHGRVKVRTSEEEKARKEKERQEKLKLFKHATQAIQHKRKEGELDKELMDLTAKVLTSNPDIYTLWNIRRETITIFRKNEEMSEEMCQIHDAELQLTEYCLKINPKSYCAWHQREWILTTRPDPDWKKELDICNKYLKFDERNFHTWDYRRFVVRQSKPPLKEEFDFTTEKLYDNFSNYSAWHYRSKMLVELYPDVKGGRPIEDSHHKHELKMVQSAAFTDPDDTSAWFYQRWLLGAVKKTIHIAVCAVTPSRTTVAFSDYVPQEFVTTKVKILFNNSAVEGEWVSCTGNTRDVLWILKHEENVTAGMDVKVEYETDSGVRVVNACTESKPSVYLFRPEADFQKKYSEPVVEELNSQLDSCRQLLALEPDSKWTLLTTTVFLHCIDAKLHHNEVIQNLQTLKSIDKLRAGYYDDLITKWTIEEQLSTSNCDNGLEYKMCREKLLTSLPHLQFYSHCESVDLSNQMLTSNVLPSLIVLQHCKNLNLQNNQLTTLRGFPSLDLEELNISSNELNQDEVEEFKKKCNFSVIF